MPRDANGNFTLVPGYLAVTGETIQASQHNPPLEDLAQSMSNSVPRNGSAPMSGPLRLADGTAAAPGLAFASNPGTGLLKTAAGIGLAVGGVKVAELTFQLPIGLGPVPWFGKVAPAGWVLCFGQTLLRASYPDLWTYVQSDIAVGISLYNNGNGATTFGIPDMRGRVAAGADNMGGVAAGRLPGFTILALGGEAAHTLTTAELALHNHGGATGNQIANHTHNQEIAASFVNITQGSASTFTGVWVGRGGSGPTSIENVVHQHGIPADGSGAAHNNIQPTAALNQILFAGA